MLFGVCGTMPANAQQKLTTDTLECHIVGFNVSPMIPSASFSKALMPSGATNTDLTMASLYDAPWLQFGVDGIYKYKSNWVVSLEGGFWFGDDNLTHRVDRMSNVYTRDSIIVTGGEDALVTCYNRALSLRIAGSKIFKVIPNNPNSGIMAKLGVGALQQQTIFMPYAVDQTSQLMGDYGRLYDHQRRGFELTEGLGFWFMSNKRNLINFYVVFEVSENWTHSTRDYIIDDFAGLHGRDENRYFDLLYTLKFCWMFPLKGKTTFDYYYY